MPIPCCTPLPPRCPSSFQAVRAVSSPIFPAIRSSGGHGYWICTARATRLTRPQQFLVLDPVIVTVLDSVSFRCLFILQGGRLHCSCHCLMGHSRFLVDCWVLTSYMPYPLLQAVVATSFAVTFTPHIWTFTYRVPIFDWSASGILEHRLSSFLYPAETIDSLTFGFT